VVEMDHSGSETAKLRARDAVVKTPSHELHLHLARYTTAVSSSFIGLTCVGSRLVQPHAIKVAGGGHVRTRSEMLCNGRRPTHDVARTSHHHPDNIIGEKTMSGRTRGA